MQLSLLLMKQIFSMFLQILMGFAVVKVGILEPKQSDVLSAFSIYVICPCMIINSFLVDMEAERLQGLIIAVIAMIIIHSLYVIITRVLEKKSLITNVESASLTYANGGNLVIPLVNALLGADQVIYCSAFSMVQNVFLWTHGMRLVGSGKKSSIKKIFLNPNMLAIFVGLILFLTGFPLPEILEDTISTVGGTVGPISMFMIGMVMGGVDFRQSFGRLRPYLICLGRLILCPLLFILLIRLSGVTKWLPFTKSVLLVSTLQMCAPVAVLVTQMANLYGSQEDARDAGAINVLSVIFCIITMPFIIWIYQVVC